MAPASASSWWSSITAADRAAPLRLSPSLATKWKPEAVEEDMAHGRSAQPDRRQLLLAGGLDDGDAGAVDIDLQPIGLQPVLHGAEEGAFAHALYAADRHPLGARGDAGPQGVGHLQNRTTTVDVPSDEHPTQGQ